MRRRACMRVTARTSRASALQGKAACARAYERQPPAAHDADAAHTTLPLPCRHLLTAPAHGTQLLRPCTHSHLLLQLPLAQQAAHEEAAHPAVLAPGQGAAPGALDGECSGLVPPAVLGQVLAPPALQPWQWQERSVRWCCERVRKELLTPPAPAIRASDASAIARGSPALPARPPTPQPSQSPPPEW